MNTDLMMQAHGINCDACDYENDTVNLEDYGSYVGRPCPECGASLLTESEFQVFKGLQAIIELVGSLELDIPDDEPMLEPMLTARANLLSDLDWG